ncbi:hypothetical protein BDB00DRAFT_764882 [Zychaea mexicana]|uniref:uncharacterized protein n=1 Tax=Zychaea mexicana TaxID=64656 RepID=UPI0022FF1A16|nr:uncharacterized protein BDB00DRAFT_764882 [Zychaea mexicana]KAI9492776.1 hypothetical protein BDB00DRAFT_764882 [Zychaea mexicana]
MYGKTNKPATAVTSSPPSSIDDWLAAHYHSEKHQQIFTFDLCKLLAPLRQSKRKRQQEDDLEEEEQEEASLSSSDDASSIITTSSSSSSSSSHKNAFTAAAVAATVSRKKSKIAASVNTNKSNHNSGSSSSNPSSSEESHHRSNGGKAPARRNTRDLSIKGFTIDPQYTFDNIDIDAQDHEFYPQGWLPLTDRLDHVPVDINWKGKPLKLDANDPYYGRLHHTEADVISHMRLSPQLYLRCKRAIIMAAREFSMLGLEFRKSDAQKVCRIDVNKSSRLWAAFNAYGWLKPNTTATLSTCT